MDITLNIATPKISVLVPTFNVESYIGYCLQSILDQTYPSDCIEVVVVDNCSSDKTFDIVESYKKLFGDRLKTFQNKENKGPAVSLNRAWKASQNEYLFLLYSDNMMHPNCISLMTQALVSFNFAGGIIFCDHNYIDWQNKVIGQWVGSHLGVGDVNRDVLESCYIDEDGSRFRPMQFLIDRKTFERIGPFSEEYFIDDWEFTIRYIIESKFYRLPEKLISFRILPNSLGNQPDIYADSLLDVVERYANRLNTKNHVLFTNTLCRIIKLYVTKNQYRKAWAKILQHRKRFLRIIDIPYVAFFLVKEVIKFQLKKIFRLGIVRKATR